ncbi:MAG: hypothetical protein ACE5WD_08920 [Candidatus Aminicenantia bacterium]
MGIEKKLALLCQKKEKGEKLPELTVNEVNNIIKRYFENYEFKRGSHIKVQDSGLKKFKEMCPDDNRFSKEGEFTIPVRGGQKVKRIYINRLSETIEIIQFMEGKSEKRS